MMYKAKYKKTQLKTLKEIISGEQTMGRGGKERGYSPRFLVMCYLVILDFKICSMLYFLNVYI